MRRRVIDFFGFAAAAAGLAAAGASGGGRRLAATTAWSSGSSSAYVCGEKLKSIAPVGSSPRQRPATSLTIDWSRSPPPIGSSSGAPASSSASAAATRGESAGTREHTSQQPTTASRHCSAARLSTGARSTLPKTGSSEGSAAWPSSGAASTSAWSASIVLSARPFACATLRDTPST